MTKKNWSKIYIRYHQLRQKKHQVISLSHLPPALGAYDSVTSKEEDFNTRIVGCWWAKIMFDAFTYDVAF